MLLAVPGLCKDVVPSVLMQNRTVFGEEHSARPCVLFISKIALCVQGHQVAWWGIVIRKNSFSYACKLQQHRITCLEKSLNYQVYFEITWRINFTWSQILKLLRQTLIPWSSFSVLFIEYTVGFTPTNICWKNMVASATHRILLSDCVTGRARKYFSNADLFGRKNSTLKYLLQLRQ